MADVGEQAIRQSIERAEAPKESAQDAIKRLAALSPLDYGLVRLSEAKRLGLQVRLLDSQVFEIRSAMDGGAPGSKCRPGSALDLWTPEPSPESVEGAQLLDQLAATFERYIVLPREAKEALALWTLHAHAIDASDHAPRLAITSPEMRCGKTNLLKVIGWLTPRALSASTLTAALVYRVVEQFKPTLIIDEADTFLVRSTGNGGATSNEELRGVLNCGHDRFAGGALRLVPVGDQFEPRRFNVFSPVAIAMIGRLPGTVRDRSINIRMARKKHGDKVERLQRSDQAALRPLASQCARWAADNLDALASANPALPETLDDRARDNWRPLLAISDRIGGTWSARARDAAQRLSGANAEDDTYPTLLLTDLRTIFAEADVDRISSERACEELRKLESRPWPEYGRGRKPITPPQLARLLKGFEISPCTIRIGAETAKGYKLCDFADAFERYLSPAPPVSAVTPSQPLGEKGFSDFSSRHTNGHVTDEKVHSSHGENDCDGVTGKITPGTDANTCGDDEAVEV
jgi:putative DNA primase/helicase